MDSATSRVANPVPRVPLGTQSVPAIEKALAILEMLAESGTGLTLPELVRRSKLPKSSVHCILITLQRQEYLHRNQTTGRYMFGRKLFSLANAAISGGQLREQALPHLYALMQCTRLTTHLAVLEADEAVLIAKVDGPGISRLATWIGKRMELHCTSLGKALISHMSEQRLEELLNKHSLPRHNENTLASVKRLREDLAKAARRGYAIDDEEDEIGHRCIGAPIFGPTWNVLAAISLAGSTTQITAENVDDLGERIKSAAAAISSAVTHSTLDVERTVPHSGQRGH